MAERLYLEIKKGDKKVAFVDKWSGFSDIEIDLAHKILCDEDNFNLISNSEDMNEFKSNIKKVIGDNNSEILEEDICFYEGSLAEIDLDSKNFLAGTIYEETDECCENMPENIPRIDFDPTDLMYPDNINELYDMMIGKDKNHSSYIIYNDKVYVVSFGYLYY